MPKPTPDDLIGSADACDLLSINRSTLSRWVSAGKLTPTHRLRGTTGAFLFKREDVEALRQGSAA